MDRFRVPVLRPLVWLGDSRERIRAFPPGVRKRTGYQLQLIQFGGMPKDAKPFKGIGTGVIELAIRGAGSAYRTVVALRLGQTMYVLHAFQKKSKKGIATPKRDVNLIQQRYAAAIEQAKNG